MMADKKEEVEDGELSDGELSDISDDNSLEDGEVLSQSIEEEFSHYDTAKYYGDSVPRTLDISATDSPASPEMAEVDPSGGHAVKVIPVDERILEKGGWVQICGPDEKIQEDVQESEEDMDEDILYLRLIALKSLANEKEGQEESSKNENSTDQEEIGVDSVEVLQLFEEQVAAGDVLDKAAQEIITIDDDDEDDPITEMKLSLNESYIATGFKQSIEIVDMTQSPSYSPTQSPQALSPAYIPSDIITSPPDSPSDCQIIEAPPPPLPPTSPPPHPPPPTSPPPPPPEPDQLIFGEPLPPGEDISAIETFSYGAFYANQPPQAPLDMDLDSGDEAESRFFRSQRNAEEYMFPPSVWDFNQTSATKVTPVKKRSRESAVRGGRDQPRQRKRRKRKSNCRDKENLEKEQQNAEESEENLRAILLAQVSKAQTSKKTTDDNDVPAKIDQEKDSAKISIPVITSVKRVNSAKKSPSLQSKKLNSVVSKAVIPNLSKEDRDKHFPNLSSRVVIPCVDNASESDDDAENASKMQKNGNGLSKSFGVNLEAFLKAARNTVPDKTTKLPHHSPKKKLILTPKLKAQALKLTLADKKRLITSKISHLSRSKQMEYQRLKEILAKKEAAKKKAVDPGTTPEAPLNKEIATNSVTTGKVVQEDDENALRIQLIANMKATLQKKKLNEIEKIKSHAIHKKVIKKKVSGGKETTKVEEEAISVTADGNKTTQVTVKVSAEKSQEKTNDIKGADKANNSVDKHSDLGRKVVEMRKTLQTSLIKLSAYMSQLQKETIGVESGLKYAAELRRQLKETEDLVRMRQEKVGKLRESIKHQHEEITTEREVMLKMENICRETGVSVPEEGAENIQKKLAQIKTTAMKVKTTKCNEARKDSGGDSSVSTKSGEDKSESESKTKALPVLQTTSKDQVETVSDALKKTDVENQ